MNKLKQLGTKFDELQLRERILVGLMVAGLIYFMVNLLLLIPEQKKQKTLLLQVASHQVELAALNTSISQISSQMTQDPLKQARTTRDSLKKAVAEAALLSKADATTPQVGALIKAMLDADRGLTLVSLKTLPVSTLYLAKAASVKPSPAVKGALPESQASIPLTPLTIYKHGVEVSIKGNYLAILPYLENLQRYPKRIFWYDAKLDVTTYPESVLKITIYTMSEQSSSLLG